MAAKVDSRSGTRSTKVTFNRTGNLHSASNVPQTNEINHEMHVKMSKKIAQLTKVIYSLNTKNDEFEEIVDGLKTTHHGELQRVTLECKEKISHYKQKMELVKEQESLISKLQVLLEEERNEKHQFVTDLEKFKKEKDGNEVEIKYRYETKMDDVSKKLIKIKDEFECRTQQFEHARRKFESDKETTIADMNHKHSIEMEKLMKAHRVRYDELQNENEKLTKDMEKLKSENNSEISNRDSEIKDIVDEYEAKCEKMKKFYQNELSAAKQKHEAEFAEQLEKMKNDEKILQISMKRNEETLRNRIRSLNGNNESLEGKVEELAMLVKAANEELKKTLNNNDNYSQELSQLQQEISVKDVRLNGLQSELNSLKSRYEGQAEELLKKSAELGSLEAVKIANAHLINDLNAEVEEVRKRCNELESERKNLGRKLSANSSEAHLQIKSLQRDLERHEDEKTKLISKFEQQITDLKANSDEKIRDLISEKEAEYKELTSKQKAVINDLQSIHSKEMETLLSTTKKEHCEEVQKLQNESSKKLEEKMRDIEELEGTIAEYEKELSNLKDDIKEKTLTHASTSDEVKKLEEKITDLHDSLDKSKGLLKSSESRAEKLQNEILQNKQEHEKQMEKADLISKNNLKDLAAELDQQWGKKLRDECERLRLRLATQQKEENDAALKQMLTLKEKEFEAYKNELQQQITRYQQQNSQLRQDLQNSKNENLELLRNNSEEISEQRIQFEETISKLKFDHSGEIENIYLENERRLKELSQKYDVDLKKIEEKLRAEHQEAIQVIMMANRAAIDALKRDTEKARNDEMEEMKNLHAEEKERLRQTLHIQHQDEIEQQNLQFEEEMEYVKDDLKKTKELRSKEFGIHSAKIEELTSLLAEKEVQMDVIRNDVSVLQDNVKTVNRELEGKVEEIRKVRREGNLNMRRREQQLAKEHQNEIDELTADHLRETQKVLAEFNRAKELLKDKIEALQLLLEQAEDRYRHRESRSEDLESIERLKKMVTERESEYQKLVEEKRYFQLELLNRETNFNKIFNSMPNVGVINPLQTNKKKRKSGTDQWNLSSTKTMQRSSSGSLSPARLDPLPHSQIHEQRLNNSKPLPKAPVQGI